MAELLEMLLRGPRGCPECGAANLPGSVHCRACGERIRNRNPFVRLLVTVLAVGIVALVVWYKLRH